MTNQSSVFKRLSVAIATAATLSLSLWSSSTLAGDPFRPSNSNPHNIGKYTEQAFKAIFEKGNYPDAKRYLQQAEASEPNEPLVYAMRASVAYTDEDKDTLKTYATKTRETAENLARTDPLRGKIYTAVGLFLEGAASFQKDNNPLEALTKLQKVVQYMDEAKKIAPDDPELNLLKGYMDLMLAVNLPFSDPSQGIDQLQKNAKPEYLAERGIALGYRDLKKYDKALDYVQRALAKTPDNPELHHLKAQILHRQGEKQKNPSLLQQAKNDFNAALAKPELLPQSTVKQIFLEQCQNQNQIDNKGRNCRALRDTIQAGAVKLPSLD